MTDEQREELLDGWEKAAPGWGRQADRFAEALAPVTDRMLAAAQLAPGKRVLELAAGPGELSLAAAKLVAPAKVLCTDGVEKMVEVARERAEEEGVENIEFQQAQLEWIDLPAATAEVILCRFGLMLAVDPESALRECRRVLAPGGRIVLAVQGAPADNSWLTAPSEAAASLGLMAAPDAGSGKPGPFALAGDGVLAGLLEDAGFFDVSTELVDFTWRYADERDWLGEKVDHLSGFAEMWRGLDDEQRGALRARLRELAAPHAQPDGSFAVPGRALVAVAEA